MHLVEGDVHGALSPTVFERNLERAEEPYILLTHGLSEKASRLLERPKIIILNRRLDLSTLSKPLFLYHEQAAVKPQATVRRTRWARYSG